MKRPLELWSRVQSTVTDSRDDTFSYPKLPRVESGLRERCEAREGGSSKELMIAVVVVFFFFAGDCIWLLLYGLQRRPAGYRGKSSLLLLLCMRYTVHGIRCSRYSRYSRYTTMFCIWYSVFLCVRFSMFGGSVGVQFQCQCQNRLWSHVESSSTQWNLKCLCLCLTRLILFIVNITYTERERDR